METNTNNTNNTKLTDYLDNLENGEPALNKISTEKSNLYSPDIRNKQWLEIPLTQLPGYRYYPEGTHITIRPATTGEIQAYSTIENKNTYDVDSKMRDMLSTCVKINYIDGTVGTYRQLMEPDKLFLITQISKLTRKDGKTIKKVTQCENGHNVDIDLIPENFIYAEPNDEIEEYFDFEKKCYIFPLESGINIELGIPKIGLLQDIYEYTMMKVLTAQNNKSKGTVNSPNITFMKCIPYMNYKKEKLKPEEIEQLEYEFTHMDENVFMFIDEAVDKIICGISHLQRKCTSCGVETRIPFSLYSLDGGPRGLFIVSNAFGKLIRK
jgi:hypothetical protein